MTAEAALTTVELEVLTATSIGDELMQVRPPSAPTYYRIGRAPRIWLRGDVMSSLAMDLAELGRPELARQIAGEAGHAALRDVVDRARADGKPLSDMALRSRVGLLVLEAVGA